MSIVPYSGGMVRGVGGKVNILGEAWGMLDFGPDRGMNARKVKFLVVEDMERPIIGWPTLQSFKYRINCGERSLESTETNVSEQCLMCEEVQGN